MLAVRSVEAAYPDPLNVMRSASNFSSKPYRGKVVSTVRQGAKSRQFRSRIKMQSQQNYEKEFYDSSGRLERVVYSNQDSEWIYFSKSRMVWKGDAKKTHPKLIPEPAEWELIARNFNLELKPGQKVANRNTWLINVVPKVKGKPHRSLWVDQDQYVILKNKEFHPDGTWSAESAFEEIEFPENLEMDLSEFKVPAGCEVQNHGFDPDYLSLEEVRQSGARTLMPKHIPQGFVFESADLFSAHGNEISHLRFTDGLNVLSLFESSAPVSTRTEELSWTPSSVVNNGVMGFSRAGKIMHWRSGSRYFTLVGNLSSGSLSRIAQSIKSQR